MVKIHESIEQIQKLKPYIPDKTQEELDEILVYWEEKKSRMREVEIRILE